MKKTVNQFPLYSKIGKSWTLNTNTNDNECSGLPENFIMGMTNQKKNPISN